VPGCCSDLGSNAWVAVASVPESRPIPVIPDDNGEALSVLTAVDRSCVPAADRPGNGPEGPIMADISIRSLAPRKFRVQVCEGQGETTHQVMVPERLGGRIEFGDDDLERVVRESFRFLLER
jgi:hypothetical protein